MISAETAIRTARSLLGTPYSELDCINLIKKVIRTSAGGDKSYTTAGTNDLWNSDAKSGKYRDLTAKQEGMSGAKPGMLAFMGVGTGDVNHVGLVTERGTVIHSSKSRGCVVETEITNKSTWNGWGVHRMIRVQDTTESGKAFGNAHVSVTSGHLNLREGASTRGKIIDELTNGQRVNIVREVLDGWVFLKTENGTAGYAASAYLVYDLGEGPELSSQDEPGTCEADDDDALFTTTTLKNGNGQFVTLMGRWEIAED